MTNDCSILVGVQTFEAHSSECDCGWTYTAPDVDSPEPNLMGYTDSDAPLLRCYDNRALLNAEAVALHLGYESADELFTLWMDE